MRNLELRVELDTAAMQRCVRLTVLPLDVTDEDSIHDAVATIVDRSGSIYALVSNAGAQIRGYFEDLTEVEIRRVFDVNLFGAMSVTRAVLPHMREAGTGRVVLVSSIGGRLGSLTLSAYCASKFGLEGFGEALFVEAAPLGIAVSLVEPGIVRTKIWDTSRRAAPGALDPESPYYAWFRQAERLTDRLVERTTVSVSDVAETVLRAVTARRPRLRYVVGRRAGALLALRRYLPGEIFERTYFSAIVRWVTRTQPFSSVRKKRSSDS